MAIAIDTMHDDIRGTLKKNTSGFVSPENIDRAINNACLDIVNESISEYESRATQFSIDQNLLFLHSFSGDATERALPSDVIKVAGVFYGDYEGDLLDLTEFNDRQQSIIIPPSTTRPIATVYNDGTAKIKILPTGTTHKIKYWKAPATCKYNYTESLGVITFTSSGSTNIDFPMNYYTKILTKALIYLAPNSKNEDSAKLEQILR